MTSSMDCRAIAEARLKLHELAQASRLAEQTGNEGSPTAVTSQGDIGVLKVELNDVGGESVTEQGTAPYQRPQQK